MVITGYLKVSGNLGAIWTVFSFSWFYLSKNSLYFLFKKYQACFVKDLGLNLRLPFSRLEQKTVFDIASSDLTT
jgi:hypothetical protein